MNIDQVIRVGCLLFGPVGSYDHSLIGCMDSNMNNCTRMSQRRKANAGGLRLPPAQAALRSRANQAISATRLPVWKTKLRTSCARSARSACRLTAYPAPIATDVGAYRCSLATSKVATMASHSACRLSGARRKDPSILQPECALEETPSKSRSIGALPAAAETSARNGCESFIAD